MINSLLSAIQISDLLAGFIAAGIAVLIVHEPIVLALKYGGFLPEAAPWSMKPKGFLRIPTIVNSVFWGGLWGMVYVLVKDFLPFQMDWENGWFFGLLIAVISNFIFLPLIKRKPLFMDSDLKMIGAVLLILSGFGIATAVFYALINLLIQLL